jgi:hypothetical protein
MKKNRNLSLKSYLSRPGLLKYFERLGSTSIFEYILSTIYLIPSSPPSFSKSVTPKLEATLKPKPELLLIVYGPEPGSKFALLGRFAASIVGFFFSSAGLMGF